MVRIEDSIVVAKTAAVRMMSLSIYNDVYIWMADYQSDDPGNKKSKSTPTQPEAIALSIYIYQELHAARRVHKFYSTLPFHVNGSLAEVPVFSEWNFYGNFLPETCILININHVH